MPLPPLNPFLARSTYATALTVILTVLNAMGIDFLGFLGTTETGLIDGIEKMLPVATMMWAWFERRSPQRRISFSAY